MYIVTKVSARRSIKIDLISHWIMDPGPHARFLPQVFNLRKIHFVFQLCLCECMSIARFSILLFKESCWQQTLLVISVLWSYTSEMER